MDSVASLAEAWIEMMRIHWHPSIHMSPPSRRRGLKSLLCRYTRQAEESPPSRRRGLKYTKIGGYTPAEDVASLAEAWIEMPG